MEFGIINKLGVQKKIRGEEFEKNSKINKRGGGRLFGTQEYRRNIAIPSIDRFIQEIKFRFNRFSVCAATLLCLIPSVTCLLEVDLDFSSIIAEYKDDLSN